MSEEKEESNIIIFVKPKSEAVLEAIKRAEKRGW
jgi:hypothetical protein